MGEIEYAKQSFDSWCFLLSLEMDKVDHRVTSRLYTKTSTLQNTNNMKAMTKAYEVCILGESEGRKIDQKWKWKFMSWGRISVAWIEGFGWHYMQKDSGQD